MSLSDEGDDTVRTHGSANANIGVRSAPIKRVPRTLVVERYFVMMLVFDL